MIPLKSDRDLAMLREAGRILARVMRRLESAVEPGVSTKELDALSERLIADAGVVPAFKGYRGYPATICASVNEEIVHGIPDDRTLKDGDILSLDAGINYQGYFSDAAVTIPVGRIDRAARKLIDVTRASLAEGIKRAKPGNQLSDVSHGIQSFVETNGFSVVRQFVGHGIGFKLHEEPEIPNFGKPHQGPVLRPGMVLALEPMVNAGTWECEILENGWTAVTRDRRLSAHFEHTVAITEHGPEILTR